jgi:hypothetical protein
MVMFVKGFNCMLQGDGGHWANAGISILSSRLGDTHNMLCAESKMLNWPISGWKSEHDRVVSGHSFAKLPEAKYFP